MPYKNAEDKRAWRLRGETDKRYRVNNPEQYRASKRKHRQKVKELVQIAKEHPCTDCGCSYPACVMDFDHVRGIKVRELSKARTYREAILELRKCDLVCANCHRIRTMNRGGFQLVPRGERGQGKATGEDQVPDVPLPHQGEFPA